MTPGSTDGPHAAPAPDAALVDRLRRAGCVFAEEEAVLLVEAADGDGAALERMVVRRTGGVPLEHVLGSLRFAGVRLAVDDGVFVPRRRTEVLVREAVAHLRAVGASRRPAVLVELCCGCAPVAAAVAAGLRPRSGSAGLTVHAVDVDPRAVACARRNLRGRGEVHVGDLDAPLPRDLAGRVDVLVANAPYVPTDAIALMPVEARDHEPRVALDGGPDGLDLARRVVDAAPLWLRPGALVVVETSDRQAPALAAHAARRGLTPRVVHASDVDGTAVAALLPG